MLSVLILQKCLNSYVDTTTILVADLLTKLYLLS